MKKLVHVKTGRGLFIGEDLTGQQFGSLVVVGLASSGVRWVCKCTCGNHITVIKSRLESGRTNSCGCQRSHNISTGLQQHGDSYTPFYRLWKSIRNRCERSKNRDYKNYGGRGIKVCDRWQEYQNFKDDMYNTYVKHKETHGIVHVNYNTTIERMNTDGDYSPENCTWATYIEQNNNKQH